LTPDSWLLRPKPKKGRPTTPVSLPRDDNAKNVPQKATDARQLFSRHGSKRVKVLASKMGTASE